MQYTIKFINLNSSNTLSEHDYLREALLLAPGAKIGDVHVNLEGDATIIYNNLIDIEVLFKNNNYQTIKPILPKWYDSLHTLFVYNINTKIADKGYREIKSNLMNTNNIDLKHVFIINQHNKKHLKLIFNSINELDRIMNNGL